MYSFVTPSRALTQVCHTHSCILVCVTYQTPTATLNPVSDTQICIHTDTHSETHTLTHTPMLEHAHSGTRHPPPLSASAALCPQVCCERQAGRGVGWPIPGQPLPQLLLAHRTCAPAQPHRLAQAVPSPPVPGPRSLHSRGPVTFPMVPGMALDTGLSQWYLSCPLSPDAGWGRRAGLRELHAPARTVTASTTCRGLVSRREGQLCPCAPTLQGRDQVALPSPCGVCYCELAPGSLREPRFGRGSWPRS